MQYIEKISIHIDKRTLAALALVSLLFIIMLPNALLQTNYGYELDVYGIKHTDIRPPTRFGAEPERYLHIPFHQIQASNDLARYNENSIYQEDMRHLSALPVLDLALIFKPQFWTHLFFSPAYAASASQLFLISMCVSGFMIYFARIGLGTITALSLSTAIYYSAFLQHWMHLFIPIFAFAPWILIATKVRRKIISTILVFYFTTAMFISNFYPPLIIPLVLSIGFIVVFDPVSREHVLSRTLRIGGAGAAAAVLSYLYLADALAIIADTSYPGPRLTGGGVDTDIAMLLQWLVPTATTNANVATTQIAPMEAAGTGAALLLALICFLQFKASWSSLEFRKKIFISAILSLTSIFAVWIMLPIPQWVGMPLLLPFVSPRRLAMGSVIVIFVLIAFLMCEGRFQVNSKRLGIIAALNVAIYLIVESGNKFENISFISLTLDFSPTLIGVVAVAVHQWRQEVTLPAMACLSTLVSLTAFGGFWGVVSAKPIFEPGEFAAKQFLDTLAERNGGLVLVGGEKANGAIIGGLGYRSIVHGFGLPKPAPIRGLFDDVDDETFDLVFNRQSIMRLSDTWDLEAPGLLVRLPTRYFNYDNVRRFEVRSEPLGSAELDMAGGFRVDAIEGRLRVLGFGRFSGLNERQLITLYSREPLDVVDYKLFAGPYDGAMFGAGFIAWLEPPEGNERMVTDEVDIEIVTTDPSLGVFRLGRE